MHDRNCNFNRGTAQKFPGGGAHKFSTFFFPALIARGAFFCVGVFEDDVWVLQVDEERRSFADFVVVVTGESPRHLRAMATSVASEINPKSTLLTVLLASGK